MVRAVCRAAGVKPAPAHLAPISATETLIAGAVSGLASEVAAHPFETVSHRAKVHPSSGYGGLLGNARLILAQGTPAAH